ncbi:hypothetical protein BDY19DRAFT_990961 [Irpex rosettiformis]|uniref:Uncharacterized protein n=1 Tax=Irpex rosettiformis TaxID=378272 RepID=A0ACB8UDA8_9APHY|nr:hypothetical protein BDY19DRAFT_990961 [Irpex rosettiformis]
MAQPTVLNIQIVSSSAQSQQVLGKRGRVEDVQIDVSRPIPYPPTPEVVEALRQRILQLEDELKGSKKKQKTGGGAVQTALPGAAPVASGSGSGSGAGSGGGASNAKNDVKTKKSRGKSLFDQLKKAAKSEKWQGMSRMVKFEDHFTQADFDLVFGCCGSLVQPTPDNKPTSKVWIRRYGSEEDYEALFGEAYKRDQLKGHQWTIGSIFNGKSQKMGQVQLLIGSIEVQWSKNTDKLVFKAEIEEQETDCMGYRNPLW